ncbi:hypothetical protein B0T14DRAFT_538411 [Immersiella caudata]|uniref:Uncharacterized protein n=1 Tax=Immersiella caudata TaxID=314043 RepID=A0AA39WJD1_9PEZI|nr:hypothetical protein B0T14DRAFT_538411 [Immersiella caudata]
MTEVELKASSETISGRTPVSWESSSLHTAIAKHFVPQDTLLAGSPKLRVFFTACNFERICGIRVRWTTNLADHLRLVDDDRAVFIFHCARFLNFQLGQERSPLPRTLIRETLNSLALLFPSTDKRTRDWLQGQAKQHCIDPQLGKCGSLLMQGRRTENFSIWHDRLVILKQAFDDSQPATFSQLWLDRRNRVQWYTFWVAVLVFAMAMFFGVVQSLEGAMQVYLAYKSFEHERER